MCFLPFFAPQYGSHHILQAVTAENEMNYYNSLHWILKLKSDFINTDLLSQVQNATKSWHFKIAFIDLTMFALSEDLGETY